MTNLATAGKEPDDSPKEPEDIKNIEGNGKNSNVVKQWFISEKDLDENPHAVEDKQIEMQVASTMHPEALTEQKPEGLLKRIWNKVSNILSFNKKEKASEEPTNVVQLRKTSDVSLENPFTTTEEDFFAKPGESIEEARARFAKKHEYSPPLTEGDVEATEKTLEDGTVPAQNSAVKEAPRKVA